MKRRRFLQTLSAVPALSATARMPAAPRSQAANVPPQGGYHPGRIPNEYSLFLPGEREALRASPRLNLIDPKNRTVRLASDSRELKVGEATGGWQLVAVLPWLNGTPTAVFEKHVTHQGAITYITELGEIANIPKRVGDLSKIRPRPINTPHGVKFERPARYIPGPDVLGEYILNSSEDPCYENVAALGPEYIGWTLVANEECAPDKSLWLEADGRSRQLNPEPKTLWAPDQYGRLFDPHWFFPSEYLYNSVPGYSKRTLLGGYLPAADIGVWNPDFKVGYEVMVIMPSAFGTKPLARVRIMSPYEPDGKSRPNQPDFTERYWNGSADDFWLTLAGVWNKWHRFFEDKMKVEIPDDWLLDSARAGIVLSRCSFKGLEPSYQIGEGLYTHIPETFPMSHFQFVWAHQIWNLTDEVEPHFQHYLDHYILPDGNFFFNTQFQVEGLLNTGVFLENSARAYDYSHDVAALRKRLPPLRRMIDFAVKRYRYTKETFPPDDPRHGLIWGSPDADTGRPDDEYPEAHPYYYQNSAWIWRGLHEHARCLERAGNEYEDEEMRREAEEVAGLAAALRVDIERSLAKSMSDRSPEMKAAGIPPIFAFDTAHQPKELTDKENDRYIMDWWNSDWGNAEIDDGHYRHRLLAGQQILGMNARGNFFRTANFLEFGTLAYLIRGEDYRRFLLTLYGNACYSMDVGNRYSPEDAWLPGSYPGEGVPTGWAAVVSSEVIPALGLRWLLCYEEHERAVVHLQKAAPSHWFDCGEVIRVEKCPTRFGLISWTTTTLSGPGSPPRWRVELKLSEKWTAEVIVHIHPPDRRPLKSASRGEVRAQSVVLSAALLASENEVMLEVA